MKLKKRIDYSAAALTCPASVIGCSAKMASAATEYRGPVVGPLPENNGGNEIVKCTKLTTVIKVALAAFIFPFFCTTASAFDFYSIPEGGVGFILRNNTPYTISMSAPVGPRMQFVTIKLRPNSKKELIVQRWSSQNGLSVYITAAYRRKIQSRRWINMRVLGNRGWLEATVVRPSPGIIRISQGSPAN